ncbi:hypothetical protein F5887DRAFT_981073 [Amanita rubescens]|nr:hypothetical protein F5887DRAFT_981073 [Amanita rubescens]
MCVGSPSAFLLWSILSIFFWIFLLSHLWTYDRFQCIKWNSGRQPGAFKRLMTYSYLGSIPLLVVFSVGITRIKYREGYTFLGGHLVPTPCPQWHPKKQRVAAASVLVSSAVAWALEIVTHLEELMFWLFLLHQGPSQRQWFRSWEFRMWSIGSAIAVVGMPITTLVTRRDPTTNLVWILLTGSMASTCTTICFFYVLARFPPFIQQVKEEGAEPSVIVRLITFYQLNQIRVVFRFIYTIPFLIVAADGIEPPYPIVDLLLMVGAIGCFVSSAITLFVFFPRSIAQESGYRVQEKPPLDIVRTPSTSALPPHQYDHHFHQAPSKTGLDMAGYENPVSMRYVHSRQLPSPRSMCSYSMESGNHYVSTGYETGSESSHVRPQSIISYSVMKSRSVPSRNTVSRNIASRADRPYSAGPITLGRRHSDGANFDAYTDSIQGARAAPTPEHAPQLHPYVR